MWPLILWSKKKCEVRGKLLSENKSKNSEIFSSEGKTKEWFWFLNLPITRRQVIWISENTTPWETPSAQRRPFWQTVITGEQARSHAPLWLWQAKRNCPACLKQGTMGHQKNPPKVYTGVEPSQEWLNRKTEIRLCWEEPRSCYFRNTQLTFPMEKQSPRD